MPLYPVRFSREVKVREYVVRYVEADTPAHALARTDLAYATASAFNDDCPDDVMVEDGDEFGDWSFTIMSDSPTLVAAVPSDLILT